MLNVTFYHLPFLQACPVLEQSSLFIIFVDPACGKGDMVVATSVRCMCMHLPDLSGP